MVPMNISTNPKLLNKLRCTSNGIRGVIGMSVNYKKNVIASVEDGEVKLK